MKEITGFQKKDNEKEKEKANMLKKNIINKFAVKNVEFVIKTLLNNKKKLTLGELYKIDSVTLPSLTDIQKILENYDFHNISSNDEKCEEKQDDNLPKIPVKLHYIKINLLQHRLTSKMQNA